MVKLNKDEAKEKTLSQLHEDNNPSSRRNYEVLESGGVWRITNFWFALSIFLALLV